MIEKLVGETGFEPATLCSQSRQEPREIKASAVNRGSKFLNGIKSGNFRGKLSGAPDVSAATGLPRFVIRIRKGDRFYYYFRARGQREPLPPITDPAFAAAYSSKLVANGLLAEAATPMPRQVVRQKVYFIQDGASGDIKIGIAKWPRKRLINMQVGTSAPLTLLAAVEGGRDLEIALHAALAAHRIRGEWFRPHPEVLAEIERLGRGLI